MSYDDSAAVSPLTVKILIEQFSACGLAAGQTVLMHSSMKSLGTWVAGGPVAVIQALLHVLGADGTLMMPAHTTENTEPSRWGEPPVPPMWWPIIRAESPAYDPAITPTRQMGIIAELFRTWHGARRSDHPIGSFAAVGKHADFLTSSHALPNMFGETSPIARLYDLDGYVLLLGVGHDNNTSLHLAEYRAHWRGKTTIKEGAAVLVNGERRWLTFDDIELETDDFNLIGAEFEKRYNITHAHVGAATVRLMRQRPLVDFAQRWIERNRS